MPIITFVANTSIGYNLIWNLFTRNEMQPLFEAMVFGLQTKDSNSKLKRFVSGRQNYFIKFKSLSNRPDRIRSEIAFIPSDNEWKIGYGSFRDPFR